MPGIRIHATDPLLRAGEGATTTVAVELPLEYKLWKPGGRDRGNEPCNACGVAHRRKAIHLRFDSAGDTIIAPDIYAALLDVPGLFGPQGRLEVVNEVATPPPLLIGAVDKAKDRIIAMPLNGQGAAEKITPASTKYESEQRIWKPYVPAMDAIRERLDKIETAKKAEKRRIFTPKPRKGE